MGCIIFNSNDLAQLLSSEFLNLHPSIVFWMNMDVSDTEEKKANDRDVADKFVPELNYKWIGWLFHIILILFGLFLGSICILYGLSQLYRLVLTDFWCDDKYNDYSLLDIHNENREHGRDGTGTSDDEGICLTTTATWNKEKLWSKDPTIGYESYYDTRNEARNITFCVFYQLIGILYVIVAVKGLCKQCVATCKTKTTTNTSDDVILKELVALELESPSSHESSGQQTKNKNDHESKSETIDSVDKQLSHKICSKCLLWIKIIMCYKCADISKKWVSVDTAYWICSKLFYEIFEIWIQILILFNYGGTDLLYVLMNTLGFEHNIKQGFHVSISAEYIQLLAAMILANGVVTGTLNTAYFES